MAPWSEQILQDVVDNVCGLGFRKILTPSVSIGSEDSRKKQSLFENFAYRVFSRTTTERKLGRWLEVKTPVHPSCVSHINFLLLPPNDASTPETSTDGTRGSCFDLALTSSKLKRRGDGSGE